MNGLDPLETKQLIALTQEKIIPLRDVPKHLPPRPNGKKLHISACYRWIGPGIRGIRLESIKVGGTTCTSLEAIQRFSERLTQQFLPKNVGVAGGRSTLQPERTAVAARLAIELGIDRA